MKKRKIVMFAALLSAAFTAGAYGQIPDFVNEAYLNAPDDVLIGVGTCKVGGALSRMAMARAIAEERARADIARQLENDDAFAGKVFTIIETAADAYTSSGRLAPVDVDMFYEAVTQDFFNPNFTRGRVVKSELDGNGIMWVVMEYHKSAAAGEVRRIASELLRDFLSAGGFD
jgi:hypothetical protein